MRTALLASLAIGALLVAGCSSSPSTTSSTPHPVSTTSHASSTSSAATTTTATTTSTASTSSSTTSSAPATAAVSIASFAFSPPTLSVKVGTVVTFTNNDPMAHTATADDGSFNTGSLASGASKAVTMTKAGTLGYHCAIHPSMKGSITVTA